MLRGVVLCTAERTAATAVTFINIMHVGYTPFLFFFLIGNVFMSTPFGQAWRKGKTPQAAMDEIFALARHAGYFLVVAQVRMARCAGKQARADALSDPSRC